MVDAQIKTSEILALKVLGVDSNRSKRNKASAVITRSTTHPHPCQVLELGMKGGGVGLRRITLGCIDNRSERLPIC